MSTAHAIRKEVMDSSRSELRAEVQKKFIKLADLDPKFDLDIELSCFDAALEMYEAQIFAHMRWALLGTKALYGLRCDVEAIEARKAIDAAMETFTAAPSAGEGAR